jgi:hypothetical protein
MLNNRFNGFGICLRQETVETVLNIEAAGEFRSSGTPG